MKKKILDFSGKPAKTYKLGRACQHCGEPIEDMARASKTHCTRYIDQIGVIHDCKRRKHQLKHQLSEDVLLDWCALQRQTKGRIEDAIAAHGDELSIEILDAYNINLPDCIKFYHNSAATVVEFLGYDLILVPNHKTYKIQKNDKSRIHNNDGKGA